MLRVRVQRLSASGVCGRGNNCRKGNASAVGKRVDRTLELMGEQGPPGRHNGLQETTKAVELVHAQQGYMP